MDVLFCCAGLGDKRCVTVKSATKISLEQQPGNTSGLGMSLDSEHPDEEQR